MAPDVRAGRLVRCWLATRRRRSSSTPPIRAAATCPRKCGRSSTSWCCALRAIRNGASMSLRRRDLVLSRVRAARKRARNARERSGDLDLTAAGKRAAGAYRGARGRQHDRRGGLSAHFWISRIARSMPAFVASGYPGDRVGQLVASMSKLIGSGPMFVITVLRPDKRCGGACPGCRRFSPAAHAQRADLAIGIDFLAIERRGVDRRLTHPGAWI